MPESTDGPALAINIRPPVSVYATYRRLSYRPWFALAEFVDNATQNYYDHRQELLPLLRQQGSKLRILITYDADDNSLTVEDNANGMEIEELTRAIVLDKPPPMTSGRSEYGMGLKTAACWLGATWAIETSRLGSSRALTATVHVPDLASNATEEIPVVIRETSPESHFTRVRIKGLYNPIRGRTLGRIRDQLGSMYREDLRSGEIEILWNGELIAFDEPPILNELLHDGTERLWRKEVDMTVLRPETSLGLKVKGWIGIRIPASQRDAGFVLLRRGRVVVGGPGEGYKPTEIFGQPNSFRSQRLIGELHLDDWPVTQAKDAFDWSGGLEDALIEELKRVGQDYMEYAEDLRQRPGQKVTSTEMMLASEKTRQAFSSQRFGTAVERELCVPTPPKTVDECRADAAKLQSVSEGPVNYRLRIGTETWSFRLHWQDRLSDAHWMEVNYPQDDTTDVFLNTSHPFFVPYLGNRGFLELIQKFVLSLALAERMARRLSPDRRVEPGDFRTYMNRVLRWTSEIEANHEE